MIPAMSARIPVTIGGMPIATMDINPIKIITVKWLKENA